MKSSKFSIIQVLAVMDCSNDSVKEPLYHPTASLFDTCYEETV